MLELLALIVGVVVLFAFKASIKTEAVKLEEHSKLKLEEVVVECAAKRQETKKKVDKLLADNNGELASHDEILTLLRFK